MVYIKTLFIRFAVLVALVSATSIFAAPNSYKIIIKKSERTLYLYRNDSLLKTYTIALGLKPVGAKEQKGDYKTPEGTYYICSKNDHSQFFLSLGLSYPNSTDAERGLQAGLISRREYQQIVTATTQHQKPPMNTRLGGDVFIHGSGIGSDWTWGCVAMENTDVKELFEIIPIGTVVVIDA